MSSSSAAAFSQLQDHHLAPLPSEQLCYVHCNFCDTVLAVSVPYTSLLKTVTVRCGHCSNLLSVNMRSLLLPAASNHHPFLSSLHHNLLEEVLTSPVPPTLMMDQPSLSNNSLQPPPPPPGAAALASKGMDQEDQLPQTPIVNRPPEKRQRVPSAYNRFIKDEIQRIKAGNPDITHREAFSAAAKNWAHFPHIHFGLMPDQALKKTGVRPPEGEGVLLKDSFFTAAAANMGVAPF